MNRFVSWSVAIELALAVFLALIISNAATFLILETDRANELRRVRVGAAEERLSAIGLLLPQLNEQAQADLIRAASVRGERIEIGDAPWVVADDERSAEVEERLREAFVGQNVTEIRAVFLQPDAPSRLRASRERDRDGSDRRVEREDPERARDIDRRRPWVERFVVSIGLGPERWLNAQFAIPRGTFLEWPLLLSAGFAALALAVAAIWMGLRVAGPLKRLAEASTAMRLGEHAAEIPVKGPIALQETVKAFNAMSKRLLSTLENQRTLIASIAHDLRTPITSLRLRCEFIEDPELKERMLASLAELQTLTEAALEAARAEGGGEKRRAVDMSALVDSLGADLADLGMPVTTEANEAVTCMCRPGEIRRAVRNLIENAVRYGGEARVTVARDGADVVVRVEDKGPGIPQDQIKDVFEPFSRLETSRNRETGGHGLGLTIARSVARNHDGDITLANRPEGGLAATLRIPLGR
jgi:signal transduction histidine kinase